MFTKFYWGLWIVLAVITVAMFATSTLGWFGITVIGFISCTLIFMGMICVTPTIVGPHAAEFQHADKEPELKAAKVPGGMGRRSIAPAAVAVQSRHA